MTLYEMIFHRKSCRSFTDEQLDGDTQEKLLSFGAKPLYPEIKVRLAFADRCSVRCICPWTTAQVLTVWSEEADGYLENVGFLTQQLDLYAQTLGLGVCWLGMGRPKGLPEPDDMKFVIMLAVGHPGKHRLRTGPEAFKRKSMQQISDLPDPRLEPARLAPSSVNSQPWYFIHEGDMLHAFCTAKKPVGDMNRIDMGITLAHLYTANPESFRSFRAETPPAPAGYHYICSCVL